MSERQPRKSNPSPSPYNLAALLIVIALVALVVGLFSFGAFNNRSVQPTAVTQAQAIESPTSETVETPTDAPTSDVVVTVVVTETATLEFLPTPSETASEPTVDSTQEPSETLAAETPTSTDESPTELPTLEPTLTPVQTPTKELPTTIPDEGHGTIIFESGGALYSQPIDAQGKAVSGSVPVVSGDPTTLGIIRKGIPSPNGKYIYLVVDKPVKCSECQGIEAPMIFTIETGEVTEIQYNLQRIFGWHPNGSELIFGDDGGTVGLYNVEERKIRTIAKVQEWLNVPWEPIVFGVAYSPDGEELIASFGLTGQGIGYQAWLVNSDGSNPHQVFESKGPIFEFAWSPDEKTIAFLSRGLEVIQPDGQNRRTLSNNFSVGWGFQPQWSPDSKYIAFVAWEDLPQTDPLPEGVHKAYQNHKIHIYDLESNTETRLIEDELGGDINPAWSPNSKHIAFLSNRSGSSELWVLDFESKTIEQFTSDGTPKRAEVTWQDIQGR